MPVATTTLAVLAAGNTALSYMGSRQAAQGARRQGNYEAQLLESQAGYADQQAKDAINIGTENESRHLAAVRQLIGSQRAGFAGQGVDVSNGSALDAQLDSAAMGAIDSTTIRNNARRQAWGFQVESADLRQRAKLTRAGGKNLATSYRNQGYSTLIGGAVDQANIYRNTR